MVDIYLLKSGQMTPSPPLERDPYLPSALPSQVHNLSHLKDILQAVQNTNLEAFEGIKSKFL